MLVLFSIKSINTHIQLRNIDIKLYESGVRTFCRQVYEMTQETGVAFFRISRLCPSYLHSDDKMAKHRHNFRG